MKPARTNHSEGNLFHPRLSQILNPDHELLQLSQRIDWNGLEKEFSSLFVATKGQPPKPVRLIVGLLLLQHVYSFSDDQVVATWVENGYWQHFCGYDYFQWKMPIHPSSLSRWRKRLGKDALQKIFSYTIKLAVGTQVVTKRSLQKAVIDTTVVPKNISYPTDSKLYFKALCKLVKKAKKEKIVLRQTYTRLAKKAYFQVHCYAKARQMKRAKKAQKKLKIFLGRVYRELERKSPKIFYEELSIVKRLLEQKRTDSNKLYSLHEPNVQCISKGKAGKKYEFGCKASFATTHKEGLLLDAQALAGNPYDGHTLQKVIEELESNTKVSLREVFVDKGYRGHGIKDKSIYISGQKRGLNHRLKKALKRRQSIEPIIGHMKVDGRLNRNPLKGIEGDENHVLLCGIGHNLRMILRKLRHFLSLLSFCGRKRMFSLQLRNPKINGL